MPGRRARAVRAVIDTNVLFVGLTQQGGAEGGIVDDWIAGEFEACVSTALAYEYAEVLERNLSPRRAARIRPVLGALLRRARFVAIHFTWRPASPDPADDHVVDCAMNADAVVVTANLRDFRRPAREIGLRVMSAAAFAATLGLDRAEEDEG
jgi:predicted nucleic acid-binding protein